MGLNHVESDSKTRAYVIKSCYSILISVFEQKAFLISRVTWMMLQKLLWHPRTPYQAYGGRSLHKQSHVELFLNLFSGRLTSR